mgnify:CR=1 FL=1
MNILLTPEEQNAAAERGVQKWLAQLTEPTAFESSAPFVYAEVCRAQVRKGGDRSVALLQLAALRWSHD